MPDSIKTWGGIAAASVKTYQGIAKASVKTVNGISLAATDPNWAIVVLLALNENGADGTTSFIDQSSIARTLTANGNAQWDTAAFPTGMTSSGLFDGTGDNVAAADSADWDLPGDFTLEGMVKWSTGAFRIVTHWTGGVGWSSYVNTTTNMGFTANGSNFNITCSALSGWHHVAWTRVGSGTNNCTAWLDGVSQGTFTNTTSFTGSNRMMIGQNDDGSFPQGWIGWISNVRITKGVARYTAGFTPPSLPLPTS